MHHCAATSESGRKYSEGRYASPRSPGRKYLDTVAHQRAAAGREDGRRLALAGAQRALSIVGVGLLVGGAGRTGGRRGAATRVEGGQDRDALPQRVAAQAVEPAGP